MTRFTRLGNRSRRARRSFKGHARRRRRRSTEGDEVSGSFQLFNGTSAATPHAAGVVALLLQRRPTLTTAEVRALLARHASRDASTGAVPNPGWGYGRLDPTAVAAMLTELEAGAARPVAPARRRP